MFVPRLVRRLGWGRPAGRVRSPGVAPVLGGARPPALAWGLGYLLMAGWALPARAQPPASGRGASDDRGTFVEAARLYEDACAACHGVAGDGRGPAARLLGEPRPRDFTSGVFKLRSTPTGSLPRDEDLYQAISRGVAGTWMPAWEESLAPEQRWALVRYVKRFSGLFAEEAPDPPVEIPPVPNPSSELVREGRFVYAMLKCGECHGARGRGDGPSAGKLKDDWGERIRAYDFTRGGYKNGASPVDLYRTLRTGLDGTPMPALEPAMVVFTGGRDADLAAVRGGLSTREVEELSAYLAGQPTTTELASMSREQIERLAERRMWALVYYVRSLERPGGLLYRLLGENPDLEGRRQPE